MSTKMASSRGVQVVRKVKPLLSVDNHEAKLRVLSLYKAWYRQLPYILQEFDIPVNLPEARGKLKEKFMEHSEVKDVRIIDMLVVKGQQDLQETLEKWAQNGHIMSKHFKETIEERPKDFMSKFLSGQD